MEKILKIGRWYRPVVANNYELLNELEPFSIEELDKVQKSFEKIIKKLEDNKLKLEPIDKECIFDFIEKARKRIMCSQQDIQQDYEHANQVNPASIVTSPETGGASDKADTQSQGNNNNDSNVGS